VFALPVCMKFSISSPRSFTRINASVVPLVRTMGISRKTSLKILLIVLVVCLVGFVLLFP